MAAPTAASVLQEIQASNLVDGQQIKQLLTDMLTLLDATNIVPQAPIPALTNSNGVAAGTAIQEAASAAVTDANFSLLAAKVNTIISSLTAAGIL
jgi:hypothetical protein